MPPRPASPTIVNQRAQKKPRYAAKPPKPAKSNAMKKYEFKKKTWPNGAEGFLKACTELMRLAWGLSSSTAVPTLPPADVLAEFTRMREGNSSNDQRPPPLSLPQQQFNKLIPAFRANPDPHNHVLGSISKLEDYVRAEVTAACQHWGLSAWRPDFRSSPESAYNETHRQIWEYLLDNLVTMGAFADYRIDHTFLHNKVLKRKQFNHFVFFRMRARWFRELIKPGVIEEEAKNNVIYRRRSTLKNNRLNWCGAARVPRRQERACEDPCAHSDDELVEMDLPNLPDHVLETLTFPLSDDVKKNYSADVLTPVKRKVYLIRQKPFRSERFTKFFMTIDEAISMEKRYMKRKAPSNIVSYPRIRDTTAPEAQFLRLPEKVPLDYFDPTAFNLLPVHMRRKYINARIAFPLDAKLIFQQPVHESMNMKEKDFMEKYGKEVRNQYVFPVEGEEDEQDDDAYTDDE